MYTLFLTLLTIIVSLLLYNLDPVLLRIFVLHLLNMLVSYIVILTNMVSYLVKPKTCVNVK